MTTTAPPATPYLFAASEKPSLPVLEVPIIIATPESVKGYGYLVEDPKLCNVEIVRWPAQGWRPIDAGTGDEGGTVEGVFHSQWDGDILMGENDAVAGHYVLGWSQDPQQAQTGTPSAERQQVLLWHMNYHPDGGQMFFPIEKQPFVVPLALPGDDLKPEQVVGFWCDGSQGLYIHPNIWHEGVFPCLDKQSFKDRQGAVHARVSCDLGQEFGCYLGVPLPVKMPQS